ncbi:hypothetical protein EB796_019486 [Bugula neritina]|uniref:Uncharacterized protein n=1 Tax=Bugula neritina TaxID=10212 RepID=A0A7J7JA27_BUGNE|nr:hypothetical protein EB796_019486 [Bugula neritina]
MNQNEVLKFTQILTSVSYRDEEGNVLTELKKCLPFISFIEERYRLLCEHEVIHWAAERGYTDTIKSLLDSVSVDQKVELLKIQNDDGCTAIEIAAENRYTDIIKCLLDGVSVDQKVELFKATNRVAIHCAAHGGHTDIIKFLLDGVSVDQKIELLEILDISDNTAIHCAAQGGHTDIIKCLLDGVSVEQKPSWFQFPPQPTNITGPFSMPYLPTPSAPQRFPRPENFTVSLPSQPAQLNAPSFNHSVDWSAFNPPTSNNMTSTIPSHLNGESSIHREADTQFKQPPPSMSNFANNAPPEVQ